ncbi:MAG: hypothetical protein BJ554DRAFT_8346 [Olpidium bornovanus]|uniref:Uncharacterized protein n=1 Tax=Olpidium bornovanus TaxID=278681 RepID=A0A8H7ZU64_9FUNG|nr:MAG: hypothetical protein BJ554DRAFT_8346 [Olpidium bornovanus]
MLVSVLAPPAKADSCARTQLLLVFVHGFASNDVTFGDFPEHVRTVLSNSLVCDVDTVVYPTCECEARVSGPLTGFYRFPPDSTTGSLTKAVDDFCEWLLNKTEERLNWNDGHACRECWTVILGHSMVWRKEPAVLRERPTFGGGLVAADAIIKLKEATRRQHRILGLVAFDR